MGLIIKLIASISFSFICPFFCRFRLNLCQSFLRKSANYNPQHGIHLEKEWLFLGVETQALWSFPTIVFSIFLSFLLFDVDIEKMCQDFLRNY